MILPFPPPSRLLKNDAPGRGFLGYLCCCCFGAPKAVLTVTLDTAQDLQKQDVMGAGRYLISYLGGSL